MTPKQKTKWVEELRSGRWQKGEGMLSCVTGNGTERHCCLGVAQKLFNIPTVSRSYLASTPSMSDLPESPIWLPRAVQEMLSMRNDTLDSMCMVSSFSDMADYIEQHVDPTEPDVAE